MPLPSCEFCDSGLPWKDCSCSWALKAQRFGLIHARQEWQSLPPQKQVVRAVHRNRAAPEAPRSNALSLSRRKPRIEDAPPARKSVSTTTGSPELHPSPDTPDTPPILHPFVARGGTFIAPPGECPYCDRRRAAATTYVKARRVKHKEKK